MGGSADNYNRFSSSASSSPTDPQLIGTYPVNLAQSTQQQGLDIGLAFELKAAPLKKQMRDLEAKITKAQTDLEVAKAAAQDQQARSIQLLSIFVSFFTFISLTYQVIKDRSGIDVVAMLSGLASILMLFIVLLDIVLFRATQPKPTKPQYLLLGFVLVLGMISVLLLSRNYILNCWGQFISCKR